MTIRKSTDFLPDYLKTVANRGFFGATLDQLVSEPSIKKFNGYVGREFAPVYRSTDSYVVEDTVERQNYQLEPGVVTVNDNRVADFYSSYSDILQRIQFHGGVVDQHSRLFANQSYSYDPHCDFDKLVNFSNYYWLPQGPDAVNVGIGFIPLRQDFDITQDAETKSYKFSDRSQVNPEITLVRNGIYRFVVNNPNDRFFIQSQPGVSGVSAENTNIGTRTILGVTNNGDDVGTVIFNVPLASAQNSFKIMPVAFEADLATTLKFSDIDNRLESEFLTAHQGIDGFRDNLENKTLVFVNQTTNSANWTSQNLDYDSDSVVDYPSTLIPTTARSDVYRIRFDVIAGDRVINLVPAHVTELNTRIFIKSGQTQNGKQYFKSSVTGLLVEFPAITADLDFLYYQSSLNANAVGIIKLVDLDTSVIDIDREILGQARYTSPNGVEFTNGLKVTFDNRVVPETYANKTYYVEGVGRGIMLIEFNNTAYNEIDYITINRSSLDYNDWSRSNRWVHESIIRGSAAYNNVAAVFDQNNRAQRPIIEFDADLQLYDHGAFWAQDVDYFDNTLTDAFGDFDVINFAGSNNMSYQGDSLLSASGKTIVFANDQDQDTRTTIYTITVVGLGDVNTPTILLLPQTQLSSRQGIRIKSGTYQNQNFYLQGTQWQAGQRKLTRNQYPLFDVVDQQNQSLSLNELSDFAGTRIFSYKSGNTPIDTVLGFSINYKNLNNLGDIEFANNYETDTYRYLEDEVYKTQNVSQGFLVRNLSDGGVEYLNVWSTPQEKTQQYQLLTVFADGETETLVFDIVPTITTTNRTSIKVYLDGKLLNIGEYSVSYTDTSTVLTFPNRLTQDTKLDVLIYSDTASQAGFYQIPANLEVNSLNQKFLEMTLGQLRSHVKQIFGSHNSLVGLELGNNNSRDLDYKNLAGTILQHSAPVVYSGLFLNHNRANIIDSIGYAQREYVKFKNRFLELADRLDVNIIGDIPQAVDLVLAELVKSKNIDSPWYYSDMVPYGSDKQIYRYQVLNVDIDSYSIENIFVDNELSNRAVLVYLNGQQLVKGQDYEFSNTIPAIVLSSSLTRQLGDEIVIWDYRDTDGNFIPETPTKLGLYPKFQPQIYLDDRYTISQTVLRGHDGSITPVFGDYRDQMLLELELRMFNNIKVQYDVKNKDVLWSVLPGKFRQSKYSRQEFESVLAKLFLKWSGTNQLDYATNSTFRIDNPKTWNYARAQSRLDSELFPGHYRAIYRYLYDTDQPHLAPWEMLGFSIKPDWWEQQYGAAPYTRGNSILWQDLELGYIAQGSRQGTDSRFARPGLRDIIPVNEFGELLTPDLFLLKNFNYTDVDNSWQVGDSGPVESAWRTGSEFPYALQIVMALTAPAEYFGLNIDNSRYLFDTNINQILHSESKNRIDPATVTVNGLDQDQNIRRVASYSNFVAEYLQSQGIRGSIFVKDLIDRLDVRLSYRLAGFGDVDNIKIYAEQTNPGSTNDSVLIPKENYQLKLHKSAPTRKATYSAVIVRKTSTGYVVEGYDYSQPYFTIIPSRTSDKFLTITGIEKTAKVFQDNQRVLLSIPYGYEFTTRQQVVDFLISYQRYLLAQGFRFESYSRDLKETQDWVLSSREFLVWSEQGWSVNSILVLSPAFDRIQLVDANSVVDVIDNRWSNSKILDQNFNVIDKNNYATLREDGNFFIDIYNQKTLGVCDLALVQYEHILILDNETVFSDVVYDPKLGSRQYRLKLVGQKSGEWDGSLYAPGFIYNSGDIPQWHSGRDYLKGDLVYYKNQVYSANNFIPAEKDFDFSKWSINTAANTEPKLFLNFAANAAKFINIYNVDADYFDQELEDYSSHLIGFSNRQYFNDFTLDKKTQIKFYQGFIKEKGTRNAVRALTRANFNKLTSDVDYSEEWAIRAGTYGAVDNQQIVEVVLDESFVTPNPFGVEFLNNNQTSTPGFRSYQIQDLLSKPVNFILPVFGDRNQTTSVYDQDLISAGFLLENEVDAVVFDLAQSQEQIAATIPEIGLGYTIWTAKDFQGRWNVYRTQQTSSVVTSMRFGLDDKVMIETQDRHNFVAGDILIIKYFDPVLDGIYQVNEVMGLTSFGSTATPIQTEYLLAIDQAVGRGTVYILKSARFQNVTEIGNYNWKAGEYAWVDHLDSWKVYQKNQPWSWNQSVQSAVNSNVWGSDVGISQDGTLLTVGAPVPGNPSVEYYNLANINSLVRRRLTSPVTTPVSFGNEIHQIDKKLFVADSEYSSGLGHVVVFDYIRQNFSVNQIIAGLDAASEFGTAITVSNDLNWLYISSPNNNKVHGYRQVELPTNQITILTTNIDTNYPLPWITSDSNAVRVYSGVTGQWLIPGVDYTTSGNEINFTVPPATSGTELFVVAETSYYQYVGEITASDSVALDQFGEQIKTSTDGAQLVVSAPENASGTGAVYIFDRIIEAFDAQQGQRDFVTLRAFDANRITVSVDGETQQLNQDYQVPAANTVRFNNPLNGSANVRIEINSWQLIEKLATVYAQVGSKFGQDIEFCATNCSIYVSQPLYTMNFYRRGLVSRYRNLSRIRGEIESGIIANPNNCVTVGHSIRLNEYEVVFTDVSLDSVIQDINNANIPGITASRVNNKIKITSQSTLTNNSLRVLPGLGTALTNLNIAIFSKSQDIFKPNQDLVENFGSRIKVNPASNKLLIAGTDSYAQIETVFDGDSVRDTTFDVDSTSFKDTVTRSGAVYQYELISDQISLDETLVFIQQISPPTLTSNEKFGKNLLFVENRIAVLSQLNADPGKIHVFENSSGVSGWQIVRQQSPVVDINSVDSVVLYDRRKNQVLAYLDVYDPQRGKALGIVEENVDYKTAFDPAGYNRVNGVDLDNVQRYFWGSAQLGRVWWDLGNIRYVEYQQSDRQSRIDNWGRRVLGSTVDIYEWVESTVPPSQYQDNGGSGVPKNIDDSAFSLVSSVDPVIGLVSSKYYFWVKDKTTAIQNRNISTSSLTDIVLNPSTQNIPYVAVLDNNSLAFYNSNRFLTGTDTVLKLVVNSQRRELPVHHEWQLVKENSNETVPEFVVKKLIDSLIGNQDIQVNDQTILLAVPDPALPVHEKYGILQRPRQTMFVDRIAAAKIFIEFINRELARHILVGYRDLSRLNEIDPLPDSTEYDLEFNAIQEVLALDLSYIDDNTVILVRSDSNRNNNWSLYNVDANSLTFIRGQQFNLPNYWTYRDWIDLEYDLRQLTDYIAEDFAQAPGTGIAVGETIKINNIGGGTWGIYRKTPTGYHPLALERATIEIAKTLYEPEILGIGFDVINFDTGPFDFNPSQDLRKVINIIRQDIAIEDLKYIWTDVIFAMFEYVFYEQNQPDWLFKTSFISVEHAIRKLIEYPTYVRDNQDYYQQYIEEVKPYKTKIREYLLKYQGEDTAEFDLTDFDYPVYYDQIQQRYQHPDIDQDLTDTPPWVYWKNNYFFSIDSIRVVDQGNNYLVEPTVVVEGGDGTARLRAVTVGGQIVSITVENSGNGFLVAPTITVVPGINPNGSFGSGGKLLARITNNKIRTFDTTLKFDRIEYSGVIDNWQSTTQYYTNEYFIADSKIYKVLQNFTSGVTFDPNNQDDYELADIGDLDSAMKRSQYYYNPITGMTANDVRELYRGVDYPGVRVKAEKFFPTTYQGALTLANSGEIVFNVGLNVAAELERPIRLKFNTTNYMDGTIKYYDGLTGDLTVELTSSVGIGTYSQWILETQAASIEDFLAEGRTQPELANVDVLYRSVFLDTSLGLKPEDINVHGGRFVDVANSHAPEELLPGRIYDTLEMRVFTRIPSGPFTDRHWGVRIFHSMNCNTHDVNLNFSSNVILENSLSSLGTSVKLRTFEEDIVLLPTPEYSPKISINGEIIRYTAYNPVTNVISGLLRGQDGTVAQNHAAGDFVEVYDNLKNQRFYYRISESRSAILTQPLLENDTEISVDDVSGLYDPSPPQNRPGVVFIDGEKIIYWSRNPETNKLGQLVRGVHGTGVAASHAAGLRVEGASQDQTLELADSRTWTQADVPTTFANSATSVAVFVKNELSYDP